MFTFSNFASKIKNMPVAFYMFLEMFGLNTEKQNILIIT